MIRVLHITTGLGLGGAEAALSRLVSRIDRREFELSVVSLTGSGPVATAIASTGIPVFCVEMNPLRRGWKGIAALAGLVRRFDPDVVHTWMYDANIFGGVVARKVVEAPVVWGIHHGSLDLAGYARATILAAKLGAPCSRIIPTRIICCSESARRSHIAQGYDEGKMIVIPNGFDLQRFQPDNVARTSFRAELGLQEETRLVGLVARYHPQKDHRNFVAAAALTAQRMPLVHFVLCGPQVDENNAELKKWIIDAQLEDCVHLLGVRQDIPRVTAALDIATLSSRTEGFPTVIGEAMASGVPCVATDTGDASSMIGTTGKVVPTRDPVALANAWEDLLRRGPLVLRELGALARSRIAKLYGLETVTRRHETLYHALASEDRGV